MYLSAKYRFTMIVVIGAISICSPSARRLQAAQAERDAVASFKLENVAGGFMTSEDLKGKVSVVDLWAIWCTPCVKEIPIYNQLYDAFQGQDVAIAGIAVDFAGCNAMQIRTVPDDDDIGGFNTLEQCGELHGAISHPLDERIRCRDSRRRRVAVVPPRRPQHHNLGE